MSQIFLISNYFFNPYATAHFILAHLILFLGIFVFLQNKKSSVNISYLILCFNVYLWLLFDAIVMSCKNQDVALIGAKAVYFGISLIPPSMYFFSVSWLGFLKNKRKWIIFSYLLGIVFIALFSFTDKFVIGVYYYFFGYFSKLSRLSILYLIFFFGISSLFFWNLIQGYRRETIPIKKTHIKYVLIAFILGFVIGSTEYLPTYGIAFYPLGFIATFLLISIIAYAIIRYKLMDIETVIHKTMMWLVASSIIFVPIILLSYWLHPWYKEATPLKVAFLCGFIFYLLTVYLKVIQPKIDHFFQKRKYDLERASEKFTLDLVHLKSPLELIKKIQDTIRDTLYSEKVSVFLYNEKSKRFLLADASTSKQITELSKDESFLNWLTKNDSLVYRDFVELDPQYEVIRNHAREYFKKTEAAVSIPLVLDKNLLGIINLGKKSNLKCYSSYDFQFLMRLKNESTIALSNSLLYGRVEEEVKIRTDELIQTQRQLIQAEKLATVGTLAGGVAHEINNPLAAVLTNAQMLLMTARDDDEKESLSLIEQAAKRCKEIVQKLMLYSRKPLGGREIKEVDLQNALTNVLSFLGYQLNQDNIKITTNLQNPPFILKGNQGELEQVFTNLILNAKDAIKHGKKQGNIDISITKQNNQITIKVKDDGIGIPREHISKIFDPFFTTKDVGEGTGLGLSICQSIIEQHNGTIAVEFQKGGGSTFTITLPSSLVSAKIEIF